MVGLDLSGEEICKQKFKPWFEAGGWRVHDFTAPDTKKFQIPQIIAELKEKGASDEVAGLVKRQLYDYVKGIEFPHDGEASRGQFMFCFDYKYHRYTHKGIGVSKEDYDKYWGFHKPWFYILIYAADRKMCYTHQLRDPVKAEYEVTNYGGYDYYNVEPDCVPANKLPAVPVEFPAELTIIESFAWNISLKRWVEHEFEGDCKPTLEDLGEALNMLNIREFRPLGLMLRRFRSPLEQALSEPRTLWEK